MPKASKVGKARAAAKATSRDVRGAPLTSQYSSSKKKDDGDDNLDPSKQQQLSRGQKKRLAKREQYLKRERMVMSSLRLQRLEEQKGRLDGLDAIREALGAAATSSAATPTTATSTKPGATSAAETTKNKLSTNKSKKTLANTEISHMSLVLQHPSFQQNPFDAIQQHLRNSLASDAEKLTQESQKRNEEDYKIESKKKEDKKERLRDAKFSKKKKGGRSFKTSRARRI